MLNAFDWKRFGWDGRRWTGGRDDITSIVSLRTLSQVKTFINCLHLVIIFVSHLQEENNSLCAYAHVIIRRHMRICAHVAIDAYPISRGQTSEWSNMSPWTNGKRKSKWKLMKNWRWNHKLFAARNFNLAFIIGRHLSCARNVHSNCSMNSSNGERTKYLFRNNDNQWQDCDQHQLRFGWMDTSARAT